MSGLHPSAWQAAKFALVGLAATALHVLIYFLAVEYADATPLWANLLAFCIAFGVSFTFHLYWTFHQPRHLEHRPWLGPLWRFSGVALIGLVLNSGAVVLVVDVLEAAYGYAAVFMVTVTPGVLFILSKFWAFSDGRPGKTPLGQTND